jgi:hypothetical protein
MKAVLVVALVASLAAVVWFWTNDGERRAVVTKETAPVSPVVPVVRVAAAPATPRVSTSARDTADLDVANAQNAERGTGLAVSDEKAARLDATDPLKRLMDPSRDLAWKLRELAKLPEQERWHAMLRVGVALAGRPEGVDEMLASLRTETDPEALVVLKNLMGALTAQKVTSEQRARFIDVMKTDDSPLRRAAAARAVIATGTAEQRQGTQPIPEVIDAIRTDPAPEVVGAIAEWLGRSVPSTEAVAAFAEALERMGPGADRRNVAIAIGRGTFVADDGADLFRRFADASTQDMKDDVAAAIAQSAAHVDDGGGRRETAEQREARVRSGRERFFRVYQATSELKIRQDLVRASMNGLNIGSFAPWHAEDTAKFLRGLVSVEGDVAQKDRLERVAKVVESGGPKASQDFDNILYGRD